MPDPSLKLVRRRGSPKLIEKRPERQLTRGVYSGGRVELEKECLCEYKKEREKEKRSRYRSSLETSTTGQN